MEKLLLEKLYTDDKLSMAGIAKLQNCSVNKIVYWMTLHKIPRRTRSEATYVKNNPNGDPFVFRDAKTIEHAWLLGLGIGLYWGEGNKANKWSIRLGNTDPALLRMFIIFLVDTFSVKKGDLRFGLQIFTDIDPDEALAYWTRELGISHSQFGHPTVTISGSIGTYRKKSQYGVVTVMYHNKKLRDMLVAMLPR